MLAKMTQRMGTTWANDVEISLSTELDNAHSLTTAELALLMTYTMEVFCEQIREENERLLEVAAPSAEARADLDRRFEAKVRRGAGQSGREGDRLQELRDAAEDPRAAKT